MCVLSTALIFGGLIASIWASGGELLPPSLLFVTSSPVADLFQGSEQPVQFAGHFSSTPLLANGAANNGSDPPWLVLIPSESDLSQAALEPYCALARNGSAAGVLILPEWPAGDGQFLPRVRARDQSLSDLLPFLRRNSSAPVCGVPWGAALTLLLGRSDFQVRGSLFAAVYHNADGSLASRQLSQDTGQSMLWSVIRAVMFGDEAARPWPDAAWSAEARGAVLADPAHFVSAGRALVWLAEARDAGGVVAASTPVSLPPSPRSNYPWFFGDQNTGSRVSWGASAARLRLPHDWPLGVHEQIATANAGTGVVVISGLVSAPLVAVDRGHPLHTATVLPLLLLGVPFRVFADPTGTLATNRAGSGVLWLRGVQGVDAVVVPGDDKPSLMAESVRVGQPADAPDNGGAAARGSLLLDAGASARIRSLELVWGWSMVAVAPGAVLDLHDVIWRGTPPTDGVQSSAAAQVRVGAYSGGEWTGPQLAFLPAAWRAAPIDGAVQQPTGRLAVLTVRGSWTAAQHGQPAPPLWIGARARLALRHHVPAADAAEGIGLGARKLSALRINGPVTVTQYGELVLQLTAESLALVSSQVPATVAPVFIEQLHLNGRLAVQPTDAGAMAVLRSAFPGDQSVPLLEAAQLRLGDQFSLAPVGFRDGHGGAAETLVDEIPAGFLLGCERRWDRQAGAKRTTLVLRPAASYNESLNDLAYVRRLRRECRDLCPPDAPNFEPLGSCGCYARDGDRDGVADCVDDTIDVSDPEVVRSGAVAVHVFAPTADQSAPGATAVGAVSVPTMSSVWVSDRSASGPPSPAPLSRLSVAGVPEAAVKRASGVTVCSNGVRLGVPVDSARQSDPLRRASPVARLCLISSNSSSAAPCSATQPADVCLAWFPDRDEGVVRALLPAAVQSGGCVSPVAAGAVSEEPSLVPAGVLLCGSVPVVWHSGVYALARRSLAVGDGDVNGTLALNGTRLDWISFPSAAAVRLALQLAANGTDGSPTANRAHGQPFVLDAGSAALISLFMLSCVVAAIAYYWLRLRRARYRALATARARAADPRVGAAPGRDDSEPLMQGRLANTGQEARAGRDRRRPPDEDGLDAFIREHGEAEDVDQRDTSLDDDHDNVDEDDLVELDDAPQRGQRNVMATSPHSSSSASATSSSSRPAPVVVRRRPARDPESEPQNRPHVFRPVPGPGGRGRGRDIAIPTRDEPRGRGRASGPGRGRGDRVGRGAPGRGRGDMMAARGAFRGGRGRGRAGGGHLVDFSRELPESFLEGGGVFSGETVPLEVDMDQQSAQFADGVPLKPMKTKTKESVAAASTTTAAAATKNARKKKQRSEAIDFDAFIREFGSDDDIARMNRGSDEEEDEVDGRGGPVDVPYEAPASPATTKKRSKRGVVKPPVGDGPVPGRAGKKKQAPKLKKNV